MYILQSWLKSRGGNHTWNRARGSQGKMEVETCSILCNPEKILMQKPETGVKFIHAPCTLERSPRSESAPARPHLSKFNLDPKWDCHTSQIEISDINQWIWIWIQLQPSLTFTNLTIPVFLLKHKIHICYSKNTKVINIKHKKNISKHWKLIPQWNLI